MIKVRGQISSIARCLEDPDTRIADLAKLFFHELAKKVAHIVDCYFMTLTMCVIDFSGKCSLQCVTRYHKSHVWPIISHTYQTELLSNHCQVSQWKDVCLFAFMPYLLLRFLFGFIQKDRLCESLIEKLCHRFRAARSNEQVYDLAYCLTLLPASERTLRKLQENLPCYQDKLVDPQVYSSFTTIMNKMKKLSKPDVKVS